MDETRVRLRYLLPRNTLISVMLVGLVISSCGTPNGSSAVKLEATAVDSYFGAFSFSYPVGWDAALLDAPPGAHTYGWLEFVPPGEQREDIYVLYSRGYEGLPTFWCSLDATFDGGHSFKAWGDCIVGAMKADGGYANISHRQANRGKIQIIEAQQGTKHKMWAFVSTKSFLGTNTVGALTFSATTDKFDQYRPYVDSMMSSFRAK